jgi:hypothetical protein
MTMMKPISIPPETTSFKKGVSMSEQLRRERIKVERSAIKEVGSDEPPKRGKPPKAKPEAGSQSQKTYGQTKESSSKLSAGSRDQTCINYP